MNANIPTVSQFDFSAQECLLPEELGKLRSCTHLASFQRKEVIFRQHTPVSHALFVKSGLVKIFKEGRNKKNFILKIAAKGEFIGLMSLFGNSMNQFSASAIEDTEIGFIATKDFNDILSVNGCFARQIIKSLSEEGLFIFERLIGQSHKQLPGRIADVILYFSDTIYKKEEFSFPFTRRELAELAGTTKESFIRTLSEFKNDKIISLEGSRVSINSIKIIRTLSELG